MKFRIISIGKWKNGPEFELFQKYKNRLPEGCIELIEISNQKTIQLESIEIHKYIQKQSDYLICLDEKGENLSTRELSAKILQIEQSGTKKRCTFIIGGADGTEDSLKTNCNLLLSFGKITWPHMLVRALLAEQLYRIHQVKIGHPYHRD